MRVIFKTIHGSRLYGLEHENSDWDYYTVIDHVEKKTKRYNKQTIIDGLDSQVVDFTTWMVDCSKGVPQALEAMFSQKAEIDLIPNLRAGYRAGRNYEAYRGMMYNMAFEGEDDFKHRRHVIRLGLNLGELMLTDTMNPSLTSGMVSLVNWYAKNIDMEGCYDLALRLAGTHENPIEFVRKYV